MTYAVDRYFKKVADIVNANPKKLQVELDYQAGYLKTLCYILLISALVGTIFQPKIYSIFLKIVLVSDFTSYARISSLSWFYANIAYVTDHFQAVLYYTIVLTALLCAFRKYFLALLTSGIVIIYGILPFALLGLAAFAHTLS